MDLQVAARAVLELSGGDLPLLPLRYGPPGAVKNPNGRWHDISGVISAIRADKLYKTSLKAISLAPKDKKGNEDLVVWLQSLLTLNRDQS